MVRMTVTEPRAALAGVMLNASFAMFMVSMATFKEERTVSRRFGRWGLGSMVKSRGDCETTVRREGCNGRTRAPKDMSGDFVMTRLVQPVVFNGENHICAQHISSNSWLTGHARPRFATSTLCPARGTSFKHLPITYPPLVSRVQCQVCCLRRQEVWSGKG